MRNDRFFYLLAGVVLLLFPPSRALAQFVSRDTVDAGRATITLAPLWRDHYDLSLTAFNEAAAPAFFPLMQQLQPRSWRCSVGRWEIATLPPPANAASRDTALLKAVEREYYRGANTLAAADDPANYHFAYLDTLLSTTLRTGAEPYLCFDYMPFTLSAEKNPNNSFSYANDTSLNGLIYSFSNGIRSSRPADPAVYARVVRNVVRHVRGRFAGTRDFGVNYIEIGNEPEIPYFFTGSAQDFYALYKAAAAEIGSLSFPLKLGCGSFAFMDTAFASTVLRSIHTDGTRADFVSYHSYSDSLTYHYIYMYLIKRMVDAYLPGAEIVNGEWGRELNGADPVYGTIEHGLFRAKVMLLMQLFGIKIAHESLFMSPGLNELGLLTLNPIGTKPASDVYVGLNRMNNCLTALESKVTQGDFLYAGKNSGGSRICLVRIADGLASGQTRTVHLLVNNLPWGNAPFTAQRSVVSDSTWSAGLGVHLVKTAALIGGVFRDTVTYGPGPGQGRLLIWELEKTQGMDRPARLLHKEDGSLIIRHDRASGIMTLIVRPASKVEDLTIYNMHGRRMDGTVSGRKNDGSLLLRWDTCRANAGVYFFCVKADGCPQYHRFVLVK